MKRPDAPVAVVGAGLAGLSCAVALEEAGVPVEVFEASDGVGGRVRTDHVDGFLLDRGFQVALTAYPELQRQFDVTVLDLRAFDPGALVWRGEKGWVVGDPFRLPKTILSTAQAPIGTPLDKLRIARLRSRVRGVDPVELLGGSDVTTADSLRDAGFSDEIVQRFFRPLAGGIQLDPDLRDSRRMFDVIFRMLADGDSVVPAAGMQAIPNQLAGRLAADTVHLNARVAATSPTSIGLQDGDEITASAVVIATDGPAASALLGAAAVPGKAAGCVYFAADEAPTPSKMVILDGTGSGPVLNVAVMSNVAPTYAPDGRHLIVAALPQEVGPDIEAVSRRQLRGWWGPGVDDWTHLASYRIPHAQPRQLPPFSPKQSVALADGRFVCGDHRDTASIQGALYSGRRCAAAVLAARV